MSESQTSVPDQGSTSTAAPGGGQPAQGTAPPTATTGNQPAPPPQPPSNADWARAALAELGQRQQNAPGPGAQPAQRPALAAPPPRGTGPVVPAARGSGSAKTPWGRGLSALLFGLAPGRHGVLEQPQDTNDDDEKRDRQAKIDKSNDFKRRREAQYAVGTAAEVTIASPSGNTLKGNFFAAGNKPLANGAPDTTRPVVLFLSGSGGTAEDQGTDVAEFYQDSGASVLAANYGGYGESTGGRPSEQSLLEDSQAMLQHLYDLGYPPEQIIIHGYSMGGAIAGLLQSHNEASSTEEKKVAFRGLVLDRPMVSSTHGVKTNTPVPGTKRLASALTRASAGKMSARKAINASDSTTRLVVSSDQGDFAEAANALRVQLKGKGGRSVEGVQSNADHFANDVMLQKNGDLLRGLVTAPSVGQTDPVPSQDVRSDQEKLTTSGLKGRMTARVKALEFVTSAVGCDLVNAGNRPKYMAKPLSDQDKQTLVALYDGLRQRIEPALEELNVLGGAANGLLASGDRAKAEVALAAMLTALGNANDKIEEYGGHPAYSDSAVDAMLAPVRNAKAFYDATPVPLRTGIHRNEVALLAQYSIVKRLTDAGTQLATADATLVQAIATERTAILQRQAQAAQPPGPQPVTQPQPPSRRGSDAQSSASSGSASPSRRGSDAGSSSGTGSPRDSRIGMGSQRLRASALLLASQS